MNMPNLNRYIVRTFLFILGSTMLFQCKKPDETSDVLYELEQISALPPSAGKIKLKTEEQYVAVLYANLFQKAISVNELRQITDAIYSVGDKQLAYEMVVSNFMNREGIELPNDSVIHFGTEAEIDKFLNDTYERFYVRPISEAEKLWFKNYFKNSDEEIPQKVKLEHVYMAFALSNEYQYY